MTPAIPTKLDLVSEGADRLRRWQNLDFSCDYTWNDMKIKQKTFEGNSITLPLLLSFLRHLSNTAMSTAEPFYRHGATGGLGGATPLPTFLLGMISKLLQRSLAQSMMQDAFYFTFWTPVYPKGSYVITHVRLSVVRPSVCPLIRP